MELSVNEIELQKQLKEIIKTNGYWSKEVLEFNSKLDLDVVIRINENVDKTYTNNFVYSQNGSTFTFSK